MRVARIGPETMRGRGRKVEGKGIFEPSETKDVPNDLSKIKMSESETYQIVRQILRQIVSIPITIQHTKFIIQAK